MKKKTREKVLNEGTRVILDGETCTSRSPSQMDPEVPHEFQSTPADGDAYMITGEKKAGLLEKFRSHMSAIAYAEAGEYAAAKDLMDFSCRVNSVLLVIEGTDLAPGTLSYALNLCHRTDSQLDILQVIGRPVGKRNYESLSHTLSQASQNIVKLIQKIDDEKIPVKVTIRFGDVNEKLVNYARRHKDVTMVILDRRTIPNESADQLAWRRLVERLALKVSVPLITVEARESACSG